MCLCAFAQLLYLTSMNAVSVSSPEKIFISASNLVKTLHRTKLCFGLATNLYHLR